jgi:amidase
VVEKLASDLEAEGARVEEALPEIDFPGLVQARSYLSKAVRLTFYPDTDEGGPPSLPEYFTAHTFRDRCIHALSRFFERYDALICPVAMRAAFPHQPTDTPIRVDGEEVSYWRIIGHTAPFNFTGHPVVVVPAGRDEDGMPIGVQIVGKRWTDTHLLGIAEAISALRLGLCEVVVSG